MIGLIWQCLLRVCLKLCIDDVYNAYIEKMAFSSFFDNKIIILYQLFGYMNSECILQDLSLVDLAKMKERDGGTWFNWLGCYLTRFK